MKVKLVVHGIVQGVGYRNLVRSVALRHDVKGFVRNVRDGSVEIVAAGSAEDIDAFEQEIKVNYRYGPQVMHVEKMEHGPEESEPQYTDFKIEKDRRL